MALSELDRALARLDAGEPADALVSLLEAWRILRAAELEALIDRLSAWLLPSLPPLLPGEDAFLARARLGQPVDVTLLVESALTLPADSLPRRLQALLAFGPDPRVGRLLVAMIEEPPATTSASFGLWAQLFSVLPQYVDARSAPRLTRRAQRSSASAPFGTPLARWIDAVLPGLPQPPVLSAMEIPRVLALGAHLERLASQPPPALALAVEPALSGPPRKETLASALALLEAGELERALDALVACWGERRLPELAELIDRLGRMVDGARPALALEPEDDFDERWKAAASGARPAAVGQLLQAYRHGSWPAIEERLKAMLGWQPDPRVATAMVALSWDPMVGTRKPLWAICSELLARHADPRRASEIEQRRATLSQRWKCIEANRIPQRKNEEDAAMKVAIEQAHPLSSGEAFLVGRLAAEVERRRGEASDASRGEREVEQALLDAIVADPTNDVPRLVYADWLKERDDPRGAFMLLDLALAQGQHVQGKRNKLLTSAESAILGPIAPLLQQPTFDRGLLDTARVSLQRGVFVVTPDERAAMVSDPRWRTLRRLSTWEDLSVLYRAAPLDSLQHLESPTLGSFLAFAEREQPVPLRSVELVDDHQDPARYEGLGALVRTLPLLRELALQIWFGDDRVTPPQVFFDSPLVRQLDKIRCGSPSTGGVSRVDEWLSRLVRAGSPVPLVELLGPGLQLLLEREPDGRYRVRLSLTHLHPSYRDRLGASLRGIQVEHIVSFERIFPEPDPETESALAPASAHLPAPPLPAEHRPHRG